MSSEHPISIEQEIAEVDETEDHNPDTAAEGSSSNKEIGGRAGPDPTRYGDWEKNGRCIDF